MSRRALQTVSAIKSGKYSNIRGMFSPSATTPTAGVWKTARQAIEDGNETTPSYSLFDMGALCWYFAQELVERGVKTPIGIADTAIGGQRIEEFMNNKSYAGAIACPDALGAQVGADGEKASHPKRSLQHPVIGGLERGFGHHMKRRPPRSISKGRRQTRRNGGRSSL